MRQIGSLPDEKSARRFEDYLLTQGIRSTVEEGREGWSIWIEDDDHLDRGRAELEQYRQSPQDARYDGTSAAQAIRADQQRRAVRRRENYVDYRTSWSRSVRSPTPLTIILVAVSCLLSVLLWLDLAAGLLRYLWFSTAREGGLAGLVELRHGQVWRLITPIFLHANAMHLLFNMLWLIDLGGTIERRKKAWFLGLLALASAVFPNLAQYFWAGPAFLGMSGVVYGLFGYVWMKDRYAPDEGLALNPHTSFYMLAWLVVCMTGWLGPIANTAHVGGLVVGVLFGGTRHWWRRLVRR